MPEKVDYLAETIEHIDITAIDAVPLIEAMRRMSLTARDLSRAAHITVADLRDGGLSGSTLKEASSWGKIDTAFEQMVYAEATLAVPLIVGYAHRRGNWRARADRRWNRLLEPLPV